MKDWSRETLLGKFAYTWDASQNSRVWPTYEDLEEGREMVDEDLTGSAPTTSTPSKAASRKAARAEKGSVSAGSNKPTQPKGKGKGRKRK